MAVDGVVLIAPALQARPPAAVTRLFDLPGAPTVGAAALRLGLRGARQALRRLGQHPTPLIEATGSETARCLQRPGTAEVLVHLTRTFTPPPPLGELGPLGVSTVVVSGADDRISRPPATRAVAEGLDARLEVLDDVGHAPQEQVPDVVAALVADFVESLGSGAPR